MTTTEQPITAAVQEIVDTQLKFTEHGYELHSDDDLWAMGMTSLNSVGLMLSIEDAFDIEFPDHLLHESTFGSVDAIAAAVTNLRSTATRTT
jgi:acyl carrier protein